MGPEFPAPSAESPACHLPAALFRGVKHHGQLRLISCGPTRSLSPAAETCKSLLRPAGRFCAEVGDGGCWRPDSPLGGWGKDRSGWRGPRSVCSRLTSSEVESTTRASALRIAIRARVQGSRPRGKGPSSAPHSAPRTTSTSGELARNPDSSFLDPLPQLPSSHPNPGSARSGPERRAGAADTWSGLRGFSGAPGRSPHPHSCYSSCRVYKATIWWLMEDTKGAGLAIASAAGSARTACRWSSERKRRGVWGSPRSHFLTLGSSASLPLDVWGRPYPWPTVGDPRWPQHSL